MTFYKLVGAGPLLKIEPEEFYRALRIAISSSHHAEIARPGHGFQYQGCAFIAVKEELKFA